MEFIYKNFYIDYLIIVHYDIMRKTIDLENIEVYNNIEFNKFSPKYEKIGIEIGYIKASDLSIIFNNNYLGDSMNQLINEPISISHNKEKEKEDSTTKRRINTDSANHSPSNNNNNNIFDENDINQINKTESKLNMNKSNINNNENDVLRFKKNNEIIKKENKADIKDTDELHNEEKFHNITQKYYRHLSLKDLNKEKIIINKKIKSDKNIKYEEFSNSPKDKKEKKDIDSKREMIYKKYLFNESKLTIDLSSFEKESFKPVGIFNPNIYCFMICILQALLSIPELNYYFLNKIYLKNNLNKSENEQNDNDTTICDAFHDFIKSYLLGKKYIEIPTPLKRICIELLGGMRMHDCQEFLVCFLEALQEEINNKEKLNIPENASMEQKWIIYRKVNNSFIDYIFTGLMRSCVQCQKCNYKSYTYDPFIDLSVSINKYKNLEKCLKQYFENEKMDCEYKCDNCKQIAKVSQIKIKLLFFLNYILFRQQKN